MDADVLSSDDVMCSCTIQIQGREPTKAWYDLTHNGEQKGRIQVVTHLVYDAVEFSERARLPPAGLLSARPRCCSRRWREEPSMRTPSPRCDAGSRRANGL